MRSVRREPCQQRRYQGGQGDERRAEKQSFHGKLHCKSVGNGRGDKRLWLFSHSGEDITELGQVLAVSFDRTNNLECFSILLEHPTTLPR